VVADFQSFDLGAPEGMATGVRFREARKVFERRVSSDWKVVVYAAPKARGGFCEEVEVEVQGGKARQLSAGCVDRTAVRSGIDTTVGAFTLEEPRLVTGSVLVHEAVVLALTFEDGTRETQPLTWISEPIDAAFFAFAVPLERLEEGHRPKALFALDANGREIAREEEILALSFSTDALRRCDNPTFSCDVMLSEKRKLVEITTEKGIASAIWVAPSRKGGTCYWSTYGEDGGGFGGGCPPAGYGTPPNALPGRSQGSGKGREVVLLWGPVGADIASIELVYQDGERATVEAVEGFVLYEIPSRHYAKSHRLALMVGRAADGREVARQQADTDSPGSYPCAEPERIGTLVNGKGVYACP
jgi:hypothetical protein